jgi:nicotinamidase-related amidase
MLQTGSSVFVLVDVQGRLAEAMHGKEALFENLRRAVAGARALGVPILWTEQSPEKIGPTIPQLAELLAGEKPIPKTSFSCCGEKAFMDRLLSSGRRQVILAGIEAHVCVYQTAADLTEAGYEVEVVSDAVSSRTEANRLLGLERIRACGARVTGVEMFLFELMRTAAHPAFREILKIVR